MLQDTNKQQVIELSDGGQTLYEFRRSHDAFIMEMIPLLQLIDTRRDVMQESVRVCHTHYYSYAICIITIK